MKTKKNIEARINLKQKLGLDEGEGDEWIYRLK